MTGFRVWSDYWKRYSFDAELYSDGSLYAMFEDDDGVTHHENTDLVIEPDTGLKDKNGKEIYEGDIVEYDWYIIGDKPAYRTKEQVVFDDMGARLGNDRIRNCINVEVIGNIHENPELLGEK